MPAPVSARSLTRRRCAPDRSTLVALVTAFIQPSPSRGCCRPCESKEPYAVPFRSSRAVKTCCDNQGRGLWVPACAGTTAEILQGRSRTALRQIFIGVERFRVFLGLGIQPAIFDH